MLLKHDEFIAKTPIKIDGPRFAASLIQSLDTETSEKLVKKLKKKAPITLAKIFTSIIIFNDFQNLTDRELRIVLPKIKELTLLQSLKGKDEQFIKKVLRVYPERKLIYLKKELADIRVTLEQADNAQKKIEIMLQDMVDDLKICIPTGSYRHRLI